MVAWGHGLPSALITMALWAGCAADYPVILRGKAADPDNFDRRYSALDTISIAFTDCCKSEGGPKFTERALQNAISNPVLRNKAEVDALLNFSVSLGEAYTARWEFQFVWTLLITIEDPTGADVAKLEALDFTVSCVPGAITLYRSSPGVDGSCPPSESRLSVSSDWGLGRPIISRAVSNSSQPTLLLAAGDTLRIDFAEDLDLARANADAAADGYSLEGDASAYVHRFFKLDQVRTSWRALRAKGHCAARTRRPTACAPRRAREPTYPLPVPVRPVAIPTPAPVQEHAGGWARAAPCGLLLSSRAACACRSPRVVSGEARERGGRRVAQCAQFPDHPPRPADGRRRLDR